MGTFKIKTNSGRKSFCQKGANKVFAKCRLLQTLVFSFVSLLILSVSDIEQVMVEFHREKAFARTGIRIVGHEEAVLKTWRLIAVFPNLLVMGLYF